MATRTYSSFLDHTSDAGFRLWGQELGVNLVLAGLVQTADTGQINWVTVTRPGVNAVGGYEIFRLADSSLFFKIEYGTGSGATTPQMWITVGQGSNGAGTLTGQLSTRVTWTAQNAPTSATTAYTTYLCVLAGALSILWKANSIATVRPSGLLCIGKTVDSAGAVSTVGYGVLRMVNTTNTPEFQSVRISATAQTFASSTWFSLVPGGVNSSQSGANIQAYHHWLNVPETLPYAWSVSYLDAEVNELNTFSAAMVGAVVHTYLACGVVSASGVANNGDADYQPAVIYE